MLHSNIIRLIAGYAVATEEKRLLNDFGDDYIEYKKNTSMIIPLLKKKTVKN